MKNKFHLLSNNTSMFLGLVNGICSDDISFTITVNRRGITVKGGDYVICRNVKPHDFYAEYTKAADAVRAATQG